MAALRIFVVLIVRHQWSLSVWTNHGHPECMAQILACSLLGYTYLVRQADDEFMKHDRMTTLCKGRP